MLLYSVLHSTRDESHMRPTVMSSIPASVSPIKRRCMGVVLFASHCWPSSRARCIRFSASGIYVCSQGSEGTRSELHRVQLGVSVHSLVAHSQCQLVRKVGLLGRDHRRMHIHAVPAQHPAHLVVRILLELAHLLHRAMQH